MHNLTYEADGVALTVVHGWLSGPQAMVSPQWVNEHTDAEIAGALRSWADNAEVLDDIECVWEYPSSAPPELISQVRGIASSDSPLKDTALKALERVAGAEKVEVDEPRKSRPKDRAGYVYILQAGQDYKIGATKRMARWMKHPGAPPPFDTALVRTYKTETMYDLEAVLHDHFAEKRIKGEWFRLTIEDLAVADQIARTGG